MHGFDCLGVPPIDLVWNNDGGFSIRESIAKLPNLFVNFSRQITTESRNLLEYSPDIIVSDTRLSSLLSGELLGIPSVVILNQLKLLLSPRLRELKAARIYEKLNGEFLGIMWSFADRILIPDLPPPYTLSEQNTWDTSTASKKLEYVGFIAPELYVGEEQINRVAQKLELDRSRPIIFVHISGPTDTRMPLVKLSIEACKALRPDIQYVISEGNPNGSTIPSKLQARGWYYEWCPVRDEIFALSNALVLRGGHAALSQAIQFGKPVLTIPIENHGEQLANSAKIASLGAGIALNANRITASQITTGVLDVIDNSKYQQKATLLMGISNRLNGIENIVKVIRSYLK
jgi:UDP:flavonoid glycosyltransferase YjiC (YdhE family)